MKIVANRCHGGFGLSHEGMLAYAKHNGIELFAYQQKDGLRGDYYRFSNDLLLKNRLLGPSYLTKDAGDVVEDKKFRKLYEKHGIYAGDIKRDDPALVAAVEELKGVANGGFANLEVVEIPGGVDWEISDYDGYETIEEVHRSW